MKSNFLSCLALILFVISTSACRPKPYPSSTISILDNPSCLPPCWQNITPGKTNRDELLTALASIHNLDQSSIVQQDYPNNNDYNLFIHGNLYLEPDVITLVSVYLLDELVIELSFMGNWNLTLEKAIEKFGEPEGVLVYHSGHGYTAIIFLIPSKGVAFSFDNIGENRRPNSIDSELEIRSVDFFSPDYYYKILDMGWFSEGKWDYQESMAHIKPWSGYGEIDKLYK